MKNTIKKLLSFVIVVVMVIGMIPGNAFNAFAADETDSVIDTAAELATALAAGGEVVLGGDFEVTTPLTVAKGVTVTLDLNGKTITGIDTTEVGFAVITNRGDLTITDSAEGGKITLTSTINSGWDRYSSVISNTVGGKLTVEAGTLEHLGGTDMAYGIDNLTNGKGTYAETVIKGGTVKSPYRAVRQFLNGVEAQNILTVTGGTVEGGNKSIWMQDPNKNANSGSLNVTADAVLKGDVYLYVTPGSTEWPVEISLAAAALKDGAEVLTGNIPEGLGITNNNGTYGVGEYYALPTATVSRIYNEDLTFAMNFKADEVTEGQLAYYGDWYADFELTFNKDVTLNANGGADGYLSGQYDEWSKNWVSVPTSDVTMKANESLKIMEYAAQSYGKPGLKVTCNDIFTFVKDFDCGVYLTPEFLAANPDIEVTLELRMYNPKNEAESYTVGETYIFTIPERPTATVKEIVNDNLTFAMNFLADEATEDQLYFYGDWYADFELTVNKDVTLNANGGADGYLSGQYDEWSKNWVSVPTSDVTLKANETLKIMEYAAQSYGKPGLKYTYKEVYEVVKDFDCGMFFTPEFLAANPDIEVTLELRMYNPEDESESYVIGETYIFKLEDAVAQNTNTGKKYSTVMDAASEAQSGDTIVLLKDHTETNVLIPVNVVFDLAGYELTATYTSVFGDIVDNSEENSGVLVVDSKHFLIQANNKQLTVMTENGYQFVEVIGFNKAWMNTNTYVFQPLFEEYAHELLKNGVAVTGVSIQVEVTWKPSEGSEDLDSRLFKYGDNLVTQFINSYKPATGKYGLMFTLTFVNPENFIDLACTVQVVSDTGVMYTA